MPPILQLLYGKNQSESVLEAPDMSIGKRNSPRVFLASHSPRRRELLALGGWECNILSAQVDETPLPDEDGIDYVQRLAKSKVVSAASQLGVDGVIIAADTSVINGPAGGGDRIFGKPCDHDEAAEMLRKLRGHTHQ